MGVVCYSRFSYVRKPTSQGVVTPSHNHLNLMIIVSKLCWRASFLSLEDTIEVAHVVISALKAYLDDGLGGVYQHARSMSHAYVDDVIAKPTACVQLEKAAECTLAHVGKVGQGFKSQFVHVVIRDVFLYAKYPPTVVFDVHFGVTGGG